MDMHKGMVLTLLVVAVLVISGCTIPGTDILIPFLGGGSKIEYTDDVIIIKNIEVTPSNEVMPSQTMTVYADIENLEEPEFGGEGVIVDVELYDYCSTLFSEARVSSSCPSHTSGMTCQIELLPQEIQTISWELTPKGPDDIKLISQCLLKIKASYDYETNAVTQITFINEEELNDRIRTGQNWKIADYEVRGYGPVKPYLEVETQQPISAADDVYGFTSLTIKNVGYGYVDGSAIRDKIEINHDLLIMEKVSDGSSCEFEMEEDGLPLINKQSSPLLCRVKATTDVEVEQTFDMKTAVKYRYEFRDTELIRIKP